MNKISANDAIKILNEIHRIDPNVMPQLISYRIVCNDNLAKHPTVQVNTSKEVGLLGILNGMFGVKDNDYGYIAAEFTTEGKLMGFKLLE